MTWFAAVAIEIVGCGGSDRAQVTGTLVRHDGAPLVGARVIARSSDASVSANGHTDREGQFELNTAEQGDGVPPGEYQISVVEDRGDRDNPSPPTIAAKYRDPSSSGLRVSVEAGSHAVVEAKLDRP